MKAGRAGLACVVVAVLAAGCRATDGTAPPVADPVEILERALSSTASLGSVHTRFEVDATGAHEGLDGAMGEGDLDLEEQELVGEIDLPPMLGGASLSVVYADRELFTRAGAGDWERIGGNGEADPLVFLPTVAKVADAFDAVLDEPDVAARLVGVETCAATSCYHVAVDAPPEAVWLTLQRLQGLGGLDLPVPDGFPPVALEAWIDHADMQLVRLRAAADGGGSSLSFEVELSAHDEPVDVSPPPLDEVAPDG